MSSELERLAAACLFPGFEGTEPPDWIRRRLERGLGGVVLFSRNVEDREQVAALTRSLRAERADVLVAIDEEGGDVTRLEAHTGSSYPGNYALGVVDDAGLTEEVAVALASDLAAVGVNLDLAPVADIDANPRNPVIGTRSFGSDPARVANHVAAFVRGVQGVGVAACAKHFPGHGDTDLDSHVDLPVIAADRRQLHEGALLPFRAAIDAGVRSIMSAHVRVPSVDDVPATVSRELLQGMLRGELGFDGLVMTDALEMAAISEGVGVEEGAVRALSAGADALCLGHDLGDRDLERIVRAIVDAARGEVLGEDRLRDAAGQVRATAEWASQPTPAASVRPDVGTEAARRALVSDGNVVLGRSPLVVELETAHSIASDPPRYRLADALGVRERARLREGDDSSRIDISDGQAVLVVRDAHRHAWLRAAVERLLAAAPDAVVVETGRPLWRPAAAHGYVATHGFARVNLDAAAELLVGRRQERPISALQSSAP